MQPRHRRFVAEYLKDLNATQAAIRAGYSPATAETAGWRLLRNQEIAARIAAGKAKQLKTADISATRTLEELRRLAFSDFGNLLSPDGKLQALADVLPEHRSTIASIKTTKKNLTSGDGVVEDVIEVKLWDKVRALEMLAKHFALLTERIEHAGGITVKWEEDAE